MLVLANRGRRHRFARVLRLAVVASALWPAYAASGSGEDPIELMPKIMHAWDNLDPAEAAPYYAKDSQLVFYDDSPLKYTGWSAYARGVRKEFAGYTSFTTTLANDVAVHRVGDSFAWGTATWRADAVKRDGSTEVVYGRWTVLFEKRGGKWLIVHEHVSVPAPSD
jgi:ketosteroid isomerase-like protein